MGYTNPEHVIKVGADPEFEWFKDGKFVAASSVTGGSGCGPTTRLGTDGCSSTGEMRPAPGLPASVARSLSSIITKACTEHEEYSIRAGSGSTTPLGGHIHFSGLDYNTEFAHKLDKFISEPLALISDSRVRANSGYGRPGEVRNQPWGFEYRTPPSWIAHPYIARGVLSMAYTLAHACAQGKLQQMKTTKDVIEFAKQLTSPERMVWDIELFLRIVKHMNEEHIYIEQIEVFRAWRKKPLVSRNADVAVAPTPKIVKYVPHMEWSSGVGMTPCSEALERIKRTQRALYDNRAISVIAASSERTASYRENERKIIFVCPTCHSALLNARAKIADMGVAVTGWDKCRSIGLSRELRGSPDAALALFKLIMEEHQADGKAPLTEKEMAIRDSELIITAEKIQLPEEPRVVGVEEA